MYIEQTFIHIVFLVHPCEFILRFCIESYAARLYCRILSAFSTYIESIQQELLLDLVMYCINKVCIRIYV